MLPESNVQSDSIASAAVEDNVHMFSWKGNEKRILVYPVDYDRQFNITCAYPSSLADRQTPEGKSATAIGMQILTPYSILEYYKLTLWNCSIQSKRYLSSRFLASTVILILLSNESSHSPTLRTSEYGS